MPFLILNLGVEMIFVLNSRLRAQAVAADKAAEVLADVGTNLFGSAFIEELFTPQPVYTSGAVLQIVTALSSSTVMRLSENSMRKLYDLVFMTVKYQVVTLRHPLELLELTLNHLEGVQQVLPAHVLPLAAAAADRVAQLAKRMNFGDWAHMRRTLLTFFAGRHVRVSVFLEAKLQKAESGAFVIPKDDFLSPSPACKPPGLVYVAGVSQPGTFAHPDAQLAYPPHTPLGAWHPQHGQPRMTRNGYDMYAAAAAAGAAAAAAVPNAGTAARPGAASAPAGDPLSRQTREMPRPRVSTVGLDVNDGSPSLTPTSSLLVQPHAATVDGLSSADRQHAYDAEVSYLAQLIGPANRAGDVHQFELELFSDGRSDVTRGSPASASAATPSPTTSVPALPPTPAAPPAAVPVTRMSASAVQEQNKRLLGILNDFDSSQARNVTPPGTGAAAAAAAAPPGSKGVNDLLDIMDEL